MEYEKMSIFYSIGNVLKSNEAKIEKLRSII